MQDMHNCLKNYLATKGSPMKKLLFAISISIIATIVFITSEIEATEYDNMKIEFLDEEFTLNMPSSEVAKKIIKIRKKYGAELIFMGGDVSIIFKGGGIGSDVNFYGNLIINNGSLTKFTRTITNTFSVRLPYGVEDSLKDALVKYTVKFGKPLYKKISERSGSIIWLYNGAKFEIKKGASGNSRSDTIIIELADEKKIKKASKKDFEELEKQLKNKDENLAKSLNYNRQREDAIERQDYIAALEACNNLIFYNPNEKTFFYRANVYCWLKKYREAGNDAEIAFYRLYKKGLKEQNKHLGENLADVVNLEAFALFNRPNRRWDIKYLRKKTDYVISEYNPQLGKIYLVRAFCLQLEKDWGEKDITEDMICSDLKKACELGICEQLKEAQESGECKKK